MAYFASGRRQAASTILGWPASPSLPDAKTLILGATLILLATLNQKHLRTFNPPRIFAVPANWVLFFQQEVEDPP